MIVTKRKYRIIKYDICNSTIVTSNFFNFFKMPGGNVTIYYYPLVIK